jgi:glycosyltransferase involved in cell wall biosynthesis
VESAATLPEVGEVILVEDRSPDNAAVLCRKLESEFATVRMIQHPDNENRGAGASRNLGISSARFDYIAFLDADDWYLPNRFKETKLIFEADPTVDGVYAPVGTYFYEDNLPFMGKVRSREEGNKMVTYFRKPIRPEELFYEMLTMSHGTFHTNGIVLKKSLLSKTGLFNERLRLHQDSEMWVRCAYFGKLVGVSDPSPVAIRAVHPENRIHKINFQTKAKYYTALFRFFKDKDMNSRDRQVIERKFINYYPGRKFHNKSKVLQIIEKSVLYVRLKTGLLSENSKAL